MIPTITTSIRHCTRDSSHTARQEKETKGIMIEMEEARFVCLLIIYSVHRKDK